MSKLKVSYYLSHPIQYYSPLFREMAKVMDLHVYYFSDSSIQGKFDRGFGKNIKWDTPLLEGYESTFIKNYSRRKFLSNRFFDLINPGVISKLRKDPAEVVMINGWKYFSVLLTVFLSKLLGKQVWISSENPYFLEVKKSPGLLFIKKILLGKILFKVVDRFLYIGKESKKFYEYYGVAADKLIFAPYCVDNDYFKAQYEKLKDRKVETKRELNLSIDRKVILFTGKFIPVKQPLDLIKAFSKLKYKNAQLVMVGDGELRRDMEKLIAESNIQNVVFPGFINQSEIAKYYSVADAMVLCSVKETWGLSINEAMNFAVPVLVGDHCGCSSDLVENDVNGYIFRSGDTDMLAEKLDHYLANDKIAEAAGAASQKKVAAYSVNTIVENLLKAK